MSTIEKEPESPTPPNNPNNLRADIFVAALVGNLAVSGLVGYVTTDRPPFERVCTFSGAEAEFYGHDNEQAGAVIRLDADATEYPDIVHADGRSFSLDTGDTLSVTNPLAASNLVRSDFSSSAMVHYLDETTQHITVPLGLREPTPECLGMTEAAYSLEVTDGRLTATPVRQTS